MTNKENIAKRNLDLDAIKGIAIVLVVIGHIIQLVICSDNYSSNWLYRFIYSFHMPLFMFISGFFAYKSGAPPNSKWLLKRFINLVVPFLTWAILKYLIKQTFTQEPLTAYLFGIVVSPDRGLWFLLVLFYNCLLLFVALKLYRGLRKAVKTNTHFQAALLQALSFIAVIGPVIYASTYTTFGGLRMCGWQITFFISGYVLAEFNCYRQGRVLDFLKGRTIRKYICACVLLLLFVLLCSWWTIDDAEYLFIPYLTSHGVGGISLSLLIYVYKFMIPFAGIAAVSVAISAFPDTVKRVFGYLGRNTEEIYVMNNLLINNYVASTYISSGLSLVLTLVVPIFISYLSKKSRIVDTVLFGRYQVPRSTRHTS